MKKLIGLLMVGMMWCGLTPVSAKHTTDSLKQIRAAYQDSLMRIMHRYSQPMTYHAEANPFLFQMMTAGTYYNDPIHQAFTIDGNVSKAQHSLNEALIYSYLNNYSFYGLTDTELKQVKALPSVNNPVEQPAIKVSDMARVDAPQAQVGDVDPLAVKPNFWVVNADVYFQFSQSYVSSNWYKGGESANTLLTGMTVEANYDDKNKIQWDNRAELKLGFITTPSDTVHGYTTNNDLFRLSSKFGYKAANNWYYTALAELENQFFPGYKSNDKTVYSKFLSPLKFDASIGMDFKKKKDDKYELSLALLPGSMNLWYIRNSEIATQHFGFNEGQHTRIKWGSRIQVDHQLYFTKNIKWKSHFYVFTSYENTESQWENTFDFQVNKLLSAKIFLNARYDDAVTGHAIQLNESLSFGISYKL